MVGGTENILIPNCMQSGQRGSCDLYCHPERLLPLGDFLTINYDYYYYYYYYSQYYYCYL